MNAFFIRFHLLYNGILTKTVRGAKKYDGFKVYSTATTPKQKL